EKESRRDRTGNLPSKDRRVGAGHQARMEGVAPRCPPLTTPRGRPPVAAPRRRVSPPHRNMTDLLKLPTFAADEVFHVVVESPRGSSVKLKCDPDLGAMTVSRPLVLGLAYPYDWGFVPSTRGPDGDPIDALVRSDVASFPGVVIACRAVAVLQIEQNHPTRSGERARN